MPNVVKGSKQEKMVVVPHRPGRRLLLVTLLALGVGGSAVGGFIYGYATTQRSQQSEQATQQELSGQLLAAEAENAELRRQVAILDRSSVMDQRATEEVQGTIRGSARHEWRNSSKTSSTTDRSFPKRPKTRA